MPRVKRQSEWNQLPVISQHLEAIFYRHTCEAGFMKLRRMEHVKAAFQELP